VSSPPALPSAENPDDKPVDPFALFRPIRKHWITVLAITLLVSVLAGFYTARQVRIYEAAASVQFDPNPPRPLGGKVESVVELGSGAVWDTREYYETQYQIIQSRRVALAVVERFGLNRDAAFLRNLPPNAPIPKSFDAWDENEAADVLRGRLRVEPVKLSRVANVRLRDANPERAAQLLQAVVEAYKELNLENVVDSTEEAAKWLRTEHDKLKGELENNEMALHRYKETKNILSVEFDDKSSMLREEIAQLNQTLTAIRTRKEEVAARRSELAKVKADDPAKLPASELLGNPLLQSFRQKYIDALREHEALLKGGLGKNHPDVKAALSAVETNRDALLGEVKNIQGALDGDLAVITRQEGGVSGLFEGSKKEALELNLLEIEYNRLRRSKDNTEKLYSLVLERSKESDLTRRLRINNISVVDYPLVPKAPVSPNLPLNVAAGFVLGLLLGVAAAIGRGYLDRTVKTPGDVEALTHATFLGLLPEVEGTLAAKKRRQKDGMSPELVVHTSPMSGVAEAARSVRTNLLFSAPDKPFRVLLVTSAGPSEGKTTVTCCVAIAMAQAGKRVVIVDTDLRRPRLHRIFRTGGKDLGPGLTSALLDPSLGDVGVQTEIPNLSVLPAGPIPPNPSELLHSERFKAYLQLLSQHYDQVILDSPPLVAVTDAAILSTIADGTMMVVRAHKTSKDLVRHASRILSDVGARMAGVVLNAVNLARDEYRYSYQYYRKNSYYAETPPAASSEARESASP
jgi:polysaccharide biosynthesis transport protein